MTYAQPTAPRSLYSALTLALAGAGIVMVVSLVGLYNAVVSARHEATQAARAVASLQTENVNLEQQLLVAFDVNAIESFAASRGLVKERDPRYLEGTSATWALASVSHF